MRKEEALASLTTFSTSQAITTAPFLDEVGTARNRRAGILRDRSPDKAGCNMATTGKRRCAQKFRKGSAIEHDSPPRGSTTVNKVCIE
jgi:hypothetical protein